jgi:hypothetical protein
MGLGFIIFTLDIFERVLIILRNINLLVILRELLLATVMLLSTLAKL